MLNWLTLLFHRQARTASRHARALVEASGECHVVGVSLRADETDRRVFAVFHQEPLPRRPTPYRPIRRRQARERGGRTRCN